MSDELYELRINGMSEESAKASTRAVPDVPELVRYSISNPDPYRRIMSKVLNGDYDLYSQAAEIIAAKDKEIERLKDENSTLFNINLERHNSIVTLLERAESVEAKLAKLKEINANQISLAETTMIQMHQELSALEAKLEARDAEVERLEGDFRRACNYAAELLERAESVEAKLAQYEAQNPVAYTLIFRKSYGVNAETTFKKFEDAEKYAIRCELPLSSIIPLYASPAPAADLKAESRHD